MNELKGYMDFQDLKPLESKVFLSSPTMHGPEMDYIKQAYDSGWMSTVGENIEKIEQMACEFMGCNYAVALSCGTAALHLAVKLAAKRLYHSSTGISTPFGSGLGGSLLGKRVFCSDLTFGATVNPVVYEGGEPVFIDSEYETWNMDPKALERAFELYPDVKLVVMVHLYGIPGKIVEIRQICEEHQALLIEDAAESLGSVYKKKQTGSFGDYGIVSFNGNKLITGSSGGMLLTNQKEEAEQTRKWSTQSRETAVWYQHEELGYNYRMSNVIAGVVRGQFSYIKEHIARKKEIYFRYKENFKDLPVSMNPYIEGIMEPNYWLSCMLIHQKAMCQQVREDQAVLYQKEIGKTCPTEILERLERLNAEGRPIWKPMHMQPIYRKNAFVMAENINPAVTRVGSQGVDTDIFARGLCLPSDIKMTQNQQMRVIETIKDCFK